MAVPAINNFHNPVCWWPASFKIRSARGRYSIDATG